MKRLAPLLLFALALLVISSCGGRADVPSLEGAVLVLPRSGLYRIPAHGSSSPVVVDDGAPLPILKSGGSTFFYVSVKPNRYSHVATAFLRWGGAAPSIRSEKSAEPAQPDPQRDAWVTRWQENDRKYLPTAQLPEPWVDKAIYPGPGITESVRITDAAPSSPLTVTIRIWSHSSASQNPDHHLVMRWNGERALEERWDGIGVYTFTFTATLSPGTNRLSLEEPGDTGAPAEVAYLDAWSVTYRRPLDLRSGPVRWKAEALAAGMTVPDDREVWVLDVTDSDSPVLVGRSRATGGFVVVPTVAGHEYWAGSPDDAAELRRIPLAEADREGLAQADYVMVADESFQKPLRPLIERHSGAGLDVAVVSPRAVYDGWGDGSPNPLALRQFLAWKAATGKPARFLLLVGDADLRPWEGRPGTTIPVTFIRTQPMGETPSDLATVTGGDFPVPAVGRVPADSPEEVKAWVEKVLSQGNLPTKDLVISGNGREFLAFADDILSALSAEGRSPKEMPASGEDARERVLGAMRPGPVWLHYVGHGSITMWGKERVLAAEDAGKWGSPSVVSAWTCLNGYFVHPQVRSMAERWLLSPKGGAVLFIAPTGEGFTHDQEMLALEFYKAMASEPTVGEAFREAVLHERSNPVVGQYVLFGDPAMRWRVSESTNGRISESVLLRSTFR